MVSTGNFAHSNLDGAMGCGASRSGENIAINWSVPATFDWWMQSSGHRANILNPAYTQIGVGLAVAPDGAYWVTVNFTG